MAAHLSTFVVFVGIPWFVGPLIIWLVKRDDAFVDAHGKEAVNFNLSLLIYGVALIIGGVILGVVTLGIAVIPIGALVAALIVFWFVVTIVASVKAANGEWYQYPMTIRLIQ